MCEAARIPIGLATEGANRNDCKLTQETIESVPVERPQPTWEHPQGVCLDKAYDHDFVRGLLKSLGFTAHIRSRGEEAKELRADLGHRARRWVVERIHSWINRYRALLIRWSKTPVNHDALLKFSFALITWQQIGIMELSG
jgi:putative transposase